MQIEADSLVKKYGDRTVVKELSLTVEPGQILGLLGPNGAGKSTTIKMLTGQTDPTSGNVVIDGEKYEKLPKKYLDSFGIMPQEVVIWDHLTVEENLYFTGRMHGVDDKALKSRINAIVDSLSLDRELNALGKNLSGGFKRRLNLAITVLHEPSVLFLDEPTPGIDPQNRAFLWDYIGHLTENKEYSVLLTDHYLDEAEKVSDQVIIMDNGEIIAEGSVEELKKKFTDGTIVRADLDKNDSNSDRQIKRLKKDLEETEESISFVDHKITFTTKELNKSTSRLFKLINEHKIHLENMVVKDPTLEDVFLILTGKDIRD